MSVREPLLLPLLALVAGVAISRVTGLTAPETALAGSLMLVLAVGAWRVQARVAGILASAGVLISLGVLLQIAHQRPVPQLDTSLDEPMVLQGCVVEPPLLFPDREQFTLELAPHARARINLSLREGENVPSLQYGQVVRVGGKVRKPHNFGNPGAFDYAGYLARQDVFWTVSVRPGDLQWQPQSCGTKWRGLVFRLQQAALARLDSLYPADHYANGMMRAILLGESSRLEKSWTENFRRTGTYHALVISGLHVTVLAGTLLFLLRLGFVSEFPALVLTAIAAWLYAYVSGLSAPVVRAAGGFTLYLIGRFVYRRPRVLNLLAAVAIGYVLLDPEALFDASFQLSFLSVAVIGWLAAPLLEWWIAPRQLAVLALEDLRRDVTLSPRVAQFRVELRLLAETLSACTRIPVRFTRAGVSLLLRLTYAATGLVVISGFIQVALAVPMIVYFHRLSLSGLSANLLVVPALSVLVPIGFVAIFSGWQVAGTMCLWLLQFAESVVAWHRRWEFNERIPDPPAWLAVLFVLSLVMLGWTLRQQRWWHWPVVALSLALFTGLVGFPWAPQFSRGILELTAVDVGQGDSLVVSFPQGQIMLVDGGGVPAFGRKRRTQMDIGEDVVSPYLFTRGVRRIDVLVCTHAHEDHTDGLPALLENFRPRELWTGANAESGVWKHVRETAVRYGVKIVPFRAGQQFAFGGTEILVVSPPADYEPTDKPKNNDSLAFRLGYGRHHFLLTGDMEKPMEERLLQEQAIGKIDVLKVAHHGSKTSSTSEFLDATQPAFALISAGRDNLFHHPHPTVLERLAEHHTMTLRTDLQGLVTVRSDGQRITTGVP